MKQPDKVNIRPEVKVLSLLQHLEYEVWYALAEFVDNALASYLQFERELKETEGNSFILEVVIEINEIDNKITIRDNAAGINEKDFPRAFRAAEVPPDNTGLSEFGVGMKSAACWFSSEWSVRTKALGEELEKTVNFNLQQIFKENLVELDVSTRKGDKLHHYTFIELLDVTKIPKGRGLGKVKEHLRSIYRDFIRERKLILKVCGEQLEYKTPKILNVPKYDSPEGKSIVWRKEIDFAVNDVIKVHGFVAIRERASTAEAGFALFRRGRVIEGSYDNGFRPTSIFGNPNSFKYQRIFGELHLEGFKVNFTKKGIQWDENLDIFLKLLRDDISHESFPLYQQAEGYRVKASDGDYRGTKKALQDTARDIEKKLPEVLNEIRNKEKLEEKEDFRLPITGKSIHREFTVQVNKTDWIIKLELSYDQSLKEMVEVGNHLVSQGLFIDNSRVIGIRLSLIHPFMVQFVGADNSKLDPILRIVAALGLSEVIAKESGANTQGEIRRNFNEIIVHLSKT